MIGALLALALAVPPADPVQAGIELTKGWTVVPGKDFVIVHPPGKDQILVPYLVDALEGEKAALERLLGVSVPGPVRVEILDGVRSLSRLTGLTEAEIRTSGTVAVAKFDKLMILSPRLLVKGYDWLDTAAHEYVHHVISAVTRDRMPVWLHEGIAKWSETLWRGKGGESWSPFSAAMLEQALKKGRLVTFEEIHPSIAKLTADRATIAFAEVLLAVDYMVRAGGPQALQRAVEQVAAGRDARDAVAAAAGQDWPRFEAGWRAFMASKPMPRGGERERIRLRFRDDPKQASEWSEWAELPDERARGFARLGQIFRERGKWVAARIEYGKGYARVGPKWAVLADQYALAMLKGGDAAGAERVLLDAIHFTPDSAALRVHLSRPLLARNDLAAARDQLVLANREDPFDPEIHAGLAKALAALGDPAGASREERFAGILTEPGSRHPQREP